MILPVEELYALENNYTGREYYKILIDRMKQQILTAIINKTWDSKKFLDSLCVVVEPIYEQNKKEEAEYVERVLKKFMSKGNQIIFRGKDGMEKMSFY